MAKNINKQFVNKQKEESLQDSDIRIEEPAEDISEEKVSSDEVKISLDAFCSQKNITWQKKARLVYYVTTDNLPLENTASEWNKILENL